MAEIRTDSLAPIPDDLTIPQFILDYHHPLRPIRKDLTPWLIEDATGRRISYEELRARTFGFANELKARWNISENDVVCLLSPNDIDWPVILWAVHRLGAIVTPANPAYSAEELAHQLTLSESRLLVAHATSLAAAQAAAQSAGIPPEQIIVLGSKPPGSPHSTVEELIVSGLSRLPAFVERRLAPGEARKKLAFLCFSSGTTGKPKAVEVSHYSMLANIIQMRQCIGKPPRYQTGDVILGVLPFFHVFGMVVQLHFHMFMGATIVVVPKFSFEDFLGSIQRYHAKHLFVVPPMVVLLCKHPATKKYDLSTVQWMMSGAAPLSAELTTQVNKIMPQCHTLQGYGLTETFTTVALSPNDVLPPTPGCAGVLIPGLTARVVKPDGMLAKFGEPGELVVTGPSIALSYYKNAQATKETFVDGWVRTGDEVVVNEKNEVFILDRIKEILKVKGFQVAPAELEGHLLDHPDVADCCVVGVPDDYSGELPLAFVALSEAALERIKGEPAAAERIKTALIKHVADAKVEYKRLAGGVEFIDKIPKNPSGKLLRRVLRDEARSMRIKPPAKAKL
ncbi:uncharacterized protein PHACADRAFT_168715 [Phanerochaete carnosa HHB-10118-sp]|uniref:Acetyl-CoA synthetase-like protein n=1 Tax=Phanerochaete carnosa (strain HHB-10118-sp) TaxID=650164 RepID=K5VE56_PHACS|nr:uncharacterized protein PHACADRAFT_168715 [Phanerochaete carnosa HHB-10118-sp]EKM61281.1 hypothetical protein PHACADRAFT_168715 [Phanerochaete carnosa HHB-10118-sp]